MLSPEQVKPLLLHNDPSIRNIATKYFSGSWSRDPSVAPLILAACRQYGIEANQNGLDWCKRFTISAEALDEIISLLAEATDESVINSLNDLLESTPGNVLRQRESAIHAATNVPTDVLTRLDRRIDMAVWPASELWRELEGIDGNCTDGEFYDSADWPLTEDLIDALARQDEPTNALICDRLRALANAGRWQEYFLVDLAGDRRIAQAIPLLLDCLLRNDEFLTERAVIAIAKIGDPEAARLIRSDSTNDRPWMFRSFAVEVLESIKDPASEQAIIELLEREPDETLRTMACQALCHMFSEPGVEVVRREILDGYDDGFASLEEPLLTVAEVLGINLPEADQWRAEMEEEKRDRERRAAEWQRLQREYEAREARMARRAEVFGPRRRPLNLAAPVDTTALQQLERPKVGRNEPCPCGSGKKYKKCCGRKF